MGGNMGGVTHTSIIFFFIGMNVLCIYRKKCGGDDYIKKKTWKTVSERCQKKNSAEIRSFGSIFSFITIFYGFFSGQLVLFGDCAWLQNFGFSDSSTKTYTHTHINTKHMHIAYILKPIHYRSNKIRFPFIVCLPLLWIGPRTR